MIRPHVRKGLQSSDQNDPVAFYHSDSTFVLLSVPGAFNEQEVQQSNEALVREIESIHAATADEFETLVSNAFHAANLTLAFSVAIIAIHEETAFLKTFGTGAITLHRAGRTVTLVSHGAYGKGIVMPTDRFELAIGEPGSKSHVEIDFTEDAGVVDVPSNLDDVVQSPPLQPPQERATPTVHLKWKPERKHLLLGLLVLIVVLLVWNMMNSYTSKTAQEDRAAISRTQEIVTQKLDQARDVFELNAARSSALIAEAKRDVDRLEKSLHGPHPTEVANLRQRVSSLQGEIVGNAKINPHEFLDLTLENKDAQGSKMWLYDGTVAVLDSRGTVYLASLEKKTLSSVKSSVLSGATVVGLSDNDIYFYKPNSGVGKITLDGEKKSVAIKNDNEWKSIIDMKIYNGNIYLLDAGKGQIWKYIPTEEGYASKSAYFQSTAYAVKANSFAFDQSVYVAQDKLLTKYTSGLQDGFSPQYPEAEPSITRVITSSDDDLVYLWDRKKGIIISLTSDGSYQRSYEADILSKASSVEVYKKNAYALLKTKLYQLPLK